MIRDYIFWVFPEIILSTLKIAQIMMTLAVPMARVEFLISYSESTFFEGINSFWTFWDIKFNFPDLCIIQYININ